MGPPFCFLVDGLTKKEEDALIATADEVSAGFLQGPYSEEEVSVLLDGDDWSLNPRFALFQGAASKVRAIDDAKQSNVNMAYSSTVKLQLQDVDYVAAMVLRVMAESRVRDRLQTSAGLVRPSTWQRRISSSLFNRCIKSMP